MTPAAKPPLHVLRGILRHLKVELPSELAKKSVALSDTTTTTAFVLQQYRASQNVSNPEEIAELRQLASDLLALRENLKERQYLYEIDAGAEVKLSPKEMSRRAAARSGLAMPDLNPNLD